MSRQTRRRRKHEKLARELKKGDWFREVKKHKGPLFNTAHPLSNHADQTVVPEMRQ